MHNSLIMSQLKYQYSRAPRDLTKPEVMKPRALKLNETGGRRARQGLPSWEEAKSEAKPEAEVKSSRLKFGAVGQSALS